MATAKKGVDALAEGLKAASGKLKGTKGSSRENFKAEADKLDKAAKAKPKAAPKAKAPKKAEPEADPSIPKPMGQNGGPPKLTAGDKVAKTGGEALRMLEALPVGGAAVKGGRAALALTKAKAASSAEKAGEVALRAGVPKKTAAAAPKAKPKKYDTSNAEDARMASDRPKLPAPASKGVSTSTKAAAGLTAGAAVAAAALSGGGKGEAKAAEKTATGKANSSTKLSADDVKTASKAMGTEGKSAPKKSSGGSGGKYPVYKKDSAQAADFRKAFASARKEGKSVFTWEGRKYNTKLKSK